MTEILIGLVSGIVSGTGMGGGTILIFLLTFMCGLEQHIAQATNLIYFVSLYEFISFISKLALSILPIYESD